MVFALRIDLESQKGISEGLPIILDLLKKYGLKASFYVAMGGESNFIELLRHRKKIPEERKITIFSKKEILRMVLFPTDFAKKNEKILKRIILEGHELGIHGWKHREWTRSFDKINIEKRINKSIKKFEMIFGKKPKSFCSPAFKINRKITGILDKKGFEVISDLEGEKPFVIPETRIINVPLTIKGKNRTPIIEYLFSESYSDEEIFNYIVEEILKKKYATMYVHGLFEPIFKKNILENLFNYLKKNKIKTETIEQIAKNENLTNY